MNKYLILAESEDEEVGTVTVYIGEVISTSPEQAPYDLVKEIREGEYSEYEHEEEEVITTMNNNRVRVVMVTGETFPNNVSRESIEENLDEQEFVPEQIESEGEQWQWAEDRKNRL